MSRKAFTGGGLGLSGIFLAFATVSGPRLCVALVILGIIGFGISASNIWAITQTLAGQRATGRWVGFQSFFGNMSGMVAPAVTGYVLQRTGQFYWAFLIVAAVAFAGAASWILLVGRVEPVIWDRKLRPRAAAATR